jgi:hypothetical protein
MLDGHRHKRVFIPGAEDFATWRTGKSQNLSLKLLRNAETVLRFFLILTIHANFSDAHQAPADDGGA